MTNAKRSSRLHNALKGMHALESARSSTIQQRLASERRQLQELVTVLNESAARDSAFADMNIRSLANARRRVRDLEEAVRRQALSVRRAEIAMQKMQQRVRQENRREDAKRRDRIAEDHVTRVHATHGASLR